MLNGLTDRDLQATKDVMETIDGPGFDVVGVDNVRPTHEGVEFDVTIQAATRTQLIGDLAEPVDSGGDVMEAVGETEREFRDRMDDAAADPDANEDEVYADEVGSPGGTEKDADESEDDVDETETAEEPDEDDGPDRDQLVREWVDERMNGHTEIDVEAAEIADDIDADGRGVYWSLQALEGYELEKQEREDQAALWTIRRPDAGDDYEYPSIDSMEEIHTEIAEWVLERIPDVDGGTFVVDPGEVSAAHELEPNSGHVAAAVRRAKGIKIVDKRQIENTHAWVVTRDSDVHDSEAATLGGEGYTADDFELSREDVEAAAQSADTLVDLADDLGVATEKALRLLGVHGLDHLITGDSQEAADV